MRAIINFVIQNQRKKTGIMPVFLLERVRGVEPLSSAWKAEVMPIYDTRDSENF